MKRDIAALADREFDLVVVGGGVYGAAVAWDASLRGLAVALVEKNDFGSGTSFNNLKTIHGGIRYLQHGDLRRIRESVRERRTLMRVAPHLVHPLPFLVPTYEGSLSRSRAALRAAVVLSDLLSWDRNRGLAADRRLEAGRALGPEECLRLAPGLEREGLTGGVVWTDAQMYNSDRVTLSFVLSASERGAVVGNHVEATGLLRDGDRIRGVVARDRLADAAGLEIRGRLVVNASGPWVDSLLETLRGSGRPRLFHLSKAMNLVTRRLLPDRVALGLTRGGRLLCIVPWRDASIVGTSHAPYRGEPDGLEATAADVEALLDEVNRAYPEAGLARTDVRLIHRGLLPMSAPAASSSNGSGGVNLLKTYRLEDHRADGIDGLLSIVGVKYTTARDVAEKAVDRALALIGKPKVPSLSAATPLVGGDVESLSDLLSSVPAPHLAYNYGTRARVVLASGELDRLSETTPVLAAEIRHAVREEMASDLPSVVLRRTELGSAGHPGRAALERAASIAAEELSWTEAKKQAEVESVESFYRART